MEEDDEYYDQDGEEGGNDEEEDEDAQDGEGYYGQMQHQFKAGSFQYAHSGENFCSKNCPTTVHDVSYLRLWCYQARRAWDRAVATWEAWPWAWGDRSGHAAAV